MCKCFVYVWLSVFYLFCCQSIVGSFKIFNEISNNFNAAEQEITLEAMGNGLTAKNYIEGARVNDKFMRSQLTLRYVINIHVWEY